MRRIWEAKSGKRSAFQLEGACVEYKKGDSLERGKRQAGPCSGTSVQGARSGGEGGSDSDRPHGPGKRQRVSAEGLGAPRL